MGEGRASIESSGYPLAFRVDPSELNLAPLPLIDGLVRIRTFARTLEGMQKEALIQYGPIGAVWRVVSDEGPWLNGSDLAPFPLAFFTAGMAASLMSDVWDEAGERGVHLDQLDLTQDNFFTMEGSALKGTMAASVQPMQVKIAACGDGSSNEFENIAETAVRQRSAANRCLRESLPSRFAIRANDRDLPWSGTAAKSVSRLSDPAAVFDAIRPMPKYDDPVLHRYLVKPEFFFIPVRGLIQIIVVEKRYDASDGRIGMLRRIPLNQKHYIEEES